MMENINVEERRKELDRNMPVWTKKTLSRHFDEQADRYADNTLIETMDEKWCYKEVLEEANRVARGLMSLGIKKRDHVALLMGNFPEFIIYKLAIAKIGAVCVPMNTNIREHELAYILNHSDTSVLIMNDHPGKIDFVKIMNNLCPELKNSEAGNSLKIARFTSLRHVICVSRTDDRYAGMISHAQLLERANLVTETDRRNRQDEAECPDDVSDIIYTSGTTGDPKGAMLTHDMFLRCAYSSVYTRAYPESLKLITALPLYHVFAYTEGFLVITFLGGTFIPLTQFNARETFQMIEKTKAQFMLGVPSMFVSLVNHAELKNYDLSSLYGVFCAAANAPATLWQRCKEELKLLELATGYGMTEVAASGMMTPPQDHLENVATTIGMIKPSGAAGKSELDGYALTYKVVDVESGVELQPGEEGELVCRGPQVTKGYYKKPQETEEVFDRDGWLKTGDLGVMREDGYFQFTGRRKEMYKTSGENVSPKSVEDVISLHPKVNQVYVVGIPDAMLGEVGVACIELKEGEEASRSEILEFCREKMARYKLPRHVVFMKASEFPMTSTGKVQKFKLAEKMKERFAIKEA